MNLDEGNGGLSSKTSSTFEDELYSVSASEILRLIQAHLMECGFHQTVRTLQRESGIGLAASSLHTTWKQLAVTGQWAAVLQGLAALDKDRIAATSACETSSTAATAGVIPLLASVHEMAILELAEIGEWETAYAAFRFLQTDQSLVGIRSELSVPTGASNTETTNGFSVGRSLEQKLAALAAERQRNDRCEVPDDYYGHSAVAVETTVPRTKSGVEAQKHSRRSELGQRLQNIIPKQPAQRLLTLLQQAIKWQSYTGQSPHIRRRFQEEDESTQRTKRRKTTIFDLVLGQVSVDSTTVGSDCTRERAAMKSKSMSKDYTKVKFGKGVVCLAAAFLPDGSGVVTGSSDGLIEFWDLDGQLRTSDLPYQKNEELLGHDNGASISALAVSNDTTMLASGASDGMVNIWKIESGQCLRSIQTTTTSSQGIKADQCSSISCLSFSPDGSRVLVAHDDGMCREFGLRTARMLKEFSGHISYITSCSYEIIHQSAGQSGAPKVDMEPSGTGRDNRQLVVITSSGDGTLRLWDGTTADLLFIFRPISIGLRSNLSPVATSIRVMDLTVSDQVASSGSPAIQTVLKLHTPANTFILVPRGQRAFLINYQGIIQQIFQDKGQDSKVKPSMFVAAAVSTTNRWLYAVQENGACCIFDVTTGKLDRTIADFGSICTSTSPSGGLEIEVSNVLHHPSRDVVGAFSSDKRQRKGKLVLWK